MALSITAEDIAAYRRDGAVLLKGVLDQDHLQRLERGLEEAYATPGGMASVVKGGDGGGETVVEQLPARRSAALQSLVWNGPLAEIAGRILKTASAQLILDQIFYKKAGPILPTAWHQDTPFLCVRGEDMARVWVSCDASPRDVTVQVVRGSHRWNVVYDTRSAARDDALTIEDAGDFTYAGIGDEALPPVPDIEGNRDSFDILSWDVEPGDAVVFQGNMLHGAQGRMHHPTPRRAFATMWGGPDLRYHAPRVGATMPLPGELNGRAIPHGARIGDLEDAFPVGWRAD